MRLIDADRLKEVLKRNTGYDYVDIIDVQPTAYNVDKVLERLQCDRCKGCIIYDECDGNCHQPFMDKVRDVVRKGGVDG